MTRYQERVMGEGCLDSAFVGFSETIVFEGCASTARKSPRHIVAAGYGCTSQQGKFIGEPIRYYRDRG